MGDQKLQGLQKDAEEITGILSDNVHKVMEREGKLADLDERGQELLNMSKDFEKTAKTVERKTRWSNTRCKIIIGATVTLGLLLLILAVVLYVHLSGGASAGSGPAQERAAGPVLESTGGATPPGR